MNAKMGRNTMVQYLNIEQLFSASQLNTEEGISPVIVAKIKASRESVQNIRLCSYDKHFVSKLHL